jgi:uncharacterized cupin superfamily protein
MTEPKRIIRLDPNGPQGQGLQRLTLDPADFQSPLPRQNGHVYATDPSLGMTVGVWDTTSMQEAFGPYPGDEYIHLLQGAFAMLDAGGNGTPVETGQAVVLRDGAPLSWMQAGYLKKVYMIVDDPGKPTPEGASAEGGVIVLPADQCLSDTDQIAHSESGARKRDRVLFTNAAGTMTVGLWDTEAMTTAPWPFPCHELATILEGTVTITGEDGAAETFGPGESFFIPAGTVTRWHVPGNLRKYYAAVAPRPALP